MAIFKLYLIVMAMASKCFCQNYTVTPLTTSPGLYYENTGEVLLSNSNWEFVTAVDYNAYLLFYEYLHLLENQWHTFCERIYDSFCTQGYHRITILLDRIEEPHESLANLLGLSITPRRVKRFWAQIGRFILKTDISAAKTIFASAVERVVIPGIERSLNLANNDQPVWQNEMNIQRTSFPIDSEKTIEVDMLKKSQGRLQNKISSLETAIELSNEEQLKELNTLKEMIGDIQHKITKQENNRKQLNGKVNDVINKLSEVDKDFKIVKEKIDSNRNDTELMNTIYNIFSNFFFLREEFEIHQKNLLDVVNKVKGGQMDSYVLSPMILTEMLQDIQPHLQEGTTFPYHPNIQNSQKLYNLIKPTVSFSNDKIIFMLKIPLVFSKTFNLHKMTSLPIGVGQNKFVFILPQAPYLMIDNTYQEFMFMAKDNFETYCERLQTGKYMCNHFQELLNSHSDEECEVDLFKSAKEIPKSCNKRIMHLDKPMFLQLQQSASWIYVIPDSEDIFITCNGISVTKPLTGTGFIRGGKDCSFRTTEFDLSSFAVLTASVVSNFTPPVNLKDFIGVTYDGVQMKGKRRIKTLLPFEFSKLEEASYSIMERETDLEPLYLTLFAILLVITSVMAYLYFCTSVFKKRGISTPLQCDTEQNKISNIKVNNTSHISDVSTSETVNTVIFKAGNEDNVPSVLDNVILNSGINVNNNDTPNVLTKEPSASNVA